MITTVKNGMKKKMEGTGEEEPLKNFREKLNRSSELNVNFVKSEIQKSEDLLFFRSSNFGDEIYDFFVRKN